MAKRTMILSLLLLLASCFKVKAQADISTNTHWYNRAAFNPASIARDNFIYVFSNVRTQWVGIEGSPTTFSILASGYLAEQKSAYGISLIRDDIGVTSALNPTLQYAYRVGLTSKLDLALGLSAGVYSRKVRASELQADVIEDPVLDYTGERFTIPDADFGLELQATHFLLGVSTTHLFSLWKKDDDFLIANHRFAYAVYRNSDSELMNYTVGIQVANRQNMTVGAATAIFRLKRPTGLLKGPTELLDLGLTYRTVNQLTLIGGLHILPDLRVGYTYDLSFGGLFRGQPSHEIILEYRLPLHVSRNTGLPWYD